MKLVKEIVNRKQNAIQIIIADRFKDVIQFGIMLIVKILIVSIQE